MSANFTKHLNVRGQCHMLCGVSTHWQNGMVERYIGVITNYACTMLLHAMSAWPEIITTEFWSFSFKHATCLHNMKPIASQDNKCPYKLFSGKLPLHHISNFHVFGCPAYVLEKNLADDNGIPKWKACAYQGIYIGHSDQHSSNVALIWNPVTKLISAQYHILFDKGFETVTSLGATFYSDELPLAFHNQLQTTKQLHSDEYADTKKDTTQHYYFDGDWDLTSCLYNKKSCIRQLPPQQQTRMTLHYLIIPTKIHPRFLIPREQHPCLKSLRIPHSCLIQQLPLLWVCQAITIPASLVNLALSLSQIENNNEQTMQNNPAPTTQQFLTLESIKFYPLYLLKVHLKKLIQ